MKFHHFDTLWKNPLLTLPWKKFFLHPCCQYNWVTGCNRTTDIRSIVGVSEIKNSCLYQKRPNEQQQCKIQVYLSEIIPRVGHLKINCFHQPNKSSNEEQNATPQRTQMTDISTEKDDKTKVLQYANP